jgi:hypothetical protein
MYQSKGEIMKALGLFFSLFFLSAVSHAWTVMVIKGSGSAQLTQGAEPARKLRVGEKIKESAVIETTAAKVRLVNGAAVLVIGENTSFQIAPPDAESTLPSLKVNKGKVRATVSPEIASQFNYRIPSAIAGVRGTELFLSASAEKEVICVLEGKVEARELIKQKRTVELKQNIGWIREGDKEPVVVETSAKERQQWQEATSL